MSELRKRLNSSMTYEEYVTKYDKAPKKPCMKPKQDPVIGLEELDLSQETQDLDCLDSLQNNVHVKIQKVYQPEQVIQEEDEDLKTPIRWVEGIVLNKDQKPARQRAQSENIQYTFISFVEKGIERKKSRKFE